jgi:hypothetical protein
MAISQLPQAPYRQDRKTFPTALSTDVIFSEVRDCNRVDFPEYGTVHPNTKKWPNHKLVYIKPVDIERNEIFEFFYAADRDNQDYYNFASGYRNIIGNVGGREFRNVQRVYVTPRESFAPYDIPFGTPMPNVPEDKFEGVDYVFFDRQQQKIDQVELDSLYVLEVHTYVEIAFLEDTLSFTSSKDDGLPEKFKVTVPQQQTEKIVEGTAEMPVLVAGELSISEDQLNPDVKLVKKVTRNVDSTPVLSGKVVTNVLQIASSQESIVDDGTTIVASALTIDGSVEPLGNGKSVQKIVTVPELFTSPAFTTQRPDVTPEKFRVAIPTTTTEESVVGDAAQPVLVTGDISASEQQVNKFVKRKTKTKRSAVAAAILSEKATDNTKQLATVTETYQTGDTNELPSATVDISSQALGDGTYVVRKVSVPEVFAAKSFTAQRPDVTPEKFRSAIPTTTTEESIIGDAAQPTLATGELSASEQQVNKFVNRKTKTKRSAAATVTLNEKATYNTKQLATVTEIYQTGDTNEVPSATVDISSQALGDGTYVVRRVKVPKLFTAPGFSATKPDVIPERFRAAIPTTTTEKLVEGKATVPNLGPSDLAKSQQQVNEFVYKDQVTTRSILGDVPLSGAKKAYVEGGASASVEEKLSTSGAIEQSLNIVDSTSTAIGGGKFIVQTTKVDSWPVLKSSEWDYQLDTQVERTEQMVSSTLDLTKDYTTYRAINKDRALQITETVPTAALTNYHLSLPVQIDLEVPSTLKSIEVIWSTDSFSGNGTSEGSGLLPSEARGMRVQAEARNQSQGSFSSVPTVKVEMEHYWGRDIPATVHFFYCATTNNSLTEAGIRNRLGNLIGSAVNKWPKFKTQSHTLVAQGGSLKVNSEAAISKSKAYDADGIEASSESSSQNQGSGYDLNIDIVNIPACIHGVINVTGSGVRTLSASSVSQARLTGELSGVKTSSAARAVSTSVTPISFPATTPDKVPVSGLYLISSKVEPYKWGWVKCSAVVLDAGTL